MNPSCNSLSDPLPPGPAAWEELHLLGVVLQAPGSHQVNSQEGVGGGVSIGGGVGGSRQGVMANI